MSSLSAAGALRAWYHALFDDLSPEAKRAFCEALPDRPREQLKHDWPFWARPEQLPPDGDWFGWLLMAGRGFGKTRSGAEWVRVIGETNPRARIALVGASLDEARAVMVEGESGVLALAAPKKRPLYEPSRKLLRWPGGAEARLFSGAEPEGLRGPQHSHAWCDELGKWPLAAKRGEASFDNLLFGLRLGDDPRVVVTTTPRPVPLVRRLVEDDGFVLTGGTTHDNAPNLPQRFIAAVEARYGGSTLGRQELAGELIADVEGALWSRTLLERCRADDDDPPEWTRVVIGVDPPASSRGDACGIVVAALDADGMAHVLADASVTRPSPERWARAVADAAAGWRADRVVAEANQGGDMVRSVLRAAHHALPVKLVHASRGKAARAEPVATLYEAGRVVHRGLFAQLEDQLCGLMTGGGYEGPGPSPDRADALVWALTDLMLTTRATPRVRLM